MTASGLARGWPGDNVIMLSFVFVRAIAHDTAQNNQRFQAYVCRLHAVYAVDREALQQSSALVLVPSL